MSRTASEFFQEKHGGHNSAKELTIREQKQSEDYVDTMSQVKRES